MHRCIQEAGGGGEAFAPPSPKFQVGGRGHSLPHASFKLPPPPTLPIVYIMNFIAVLDVVLHYFVSTNRRRKAVFKKNVAP